MANTKLPARLLDDSVIPAAYISGTLAVDTNTLRVDAVNDRVGIGITSPSELLHVKGTNGSIAVDGNGSGNTASIKFINDNERSRITSAYDTGGGGRLTFHTDTTGGSLVERMRIDNDGNVGIGQPSPGYKLEVNGTAHVVNTLSVGALTIPGYGITLNQGFGSGVPTMTMVGTSANGRAGALLFQEQGAANTAAIYSTDGGGGNANYGGLLLATYQSDIRFSTSGLSNTRMIVKDDGKVGIGISTGLDRNLHIKGSDSDVGIQIEKDGSGELRIAYDSTGPYLYAENTSHGFRFYAGNAIRLQIDPGASAGLLQVGAFGVTGLNTSAAIHGGSNDAALVLSNGALSTSNSSYAWAGRGSRYLTSNGTNWTADGSDPALVVANNTANDNRGNGLGIILHNDSNTDTHYGPIVGWGTKSASNSYNSMYAYIVGKRTGNGVDANWSKGELQFDTAGVKPGGSNAYMTDTPAMTITEQAYIRKPYQPYIRLQGNNGTRVTHHGTTSTYTNFQVAQARGITWTSGTGLVTVPITGQYLITYSFYLWMDNVGHGVSHSVVLYHNSTSRQEAIMELSNNPGGSYIFDNTLSNNLILTMNTGDTLRWQCYADIYGGMTHTNASVYLLG